MNGMTALALVYTSFKAEEETFSRETDTQKESEGDNANNVSVCGLRRTQFFLSIVAHERKTWNDQEKERNNEKERTTEKKLTT